MKIQSCVLILTSIILVSCENDYQVLSNKADYYDQATENLLQGTDEDEVISGQNVHAAYGNDEVHGTEYHDVLDGGHGEDKVFGGPGNDLIISRSDGREARIAMEYSIYRDPDGLVNTSTKTIYADQPIKANDELSGGEGSDIFRFITLVNAKEKFISNNTKSDGSIEWMKITQKNTHIHDHWVDRIGNDVITDFSRTEGDKIEIIGHTASIYYVEYLDTNNDGNLNASVIYLRADQNAKGAHHKDHLGTITVYGDLVQASDIYKNNIPAIGIIKNIDNLNEAIQARFFETEPEADRVPSTDNVMNTKAFKKGTAN